MSLDRQDSLLTTAQRVFLKGKADYDMTDSGGRATRSRMRERIRSGLRDFTLLASDDGLAGQDLVQIREKLLEEGELDAVLQEMIAFIFRLRPEQFDQIVKGGAELGVQRFDPDYAVGEVRIPIHKQGTLLRGARRKLENGEPLTDSEIRVLLTDSEIDVDTVQENVRSHPKTEIERYTRRYR